MGAGDTPLVNQSPGLPGVVGLGDIPQANPGDVPVWQHFQNLEEKLELIFKGIRLVAEPYEAVDMGHLDVTTNGQDRVVYASLANTLVYGGFSVRNLSNTDPAEFRLFDGQTGVPHGLERVTLLGFQSTGTVYAPSGVRTKNRRIIVDDVVGDIALVVFVREQ